MKKDTLCWNCNKTCGRCSWTRDFTPVKGWNAKPVKLRIYTGKYTESYLVIECPEFEEFCPNYISESKFVYYRKFVKYKNFLTESDAQIFEYWLRHSSSETAQEFSLSQRTALRRIANTKKHLYHLSQIYD